MSDTPDSQASTDSPATGPTVSLCKVADLEPGTAKRIDIEGHRIAVVHLDDERWFAIDDECSHADYSLAEGEIDVEECTLECWKHGSQFSLETGEPLTLPATRSVRVYDLQIADGEVAVTLPGADDE